MLLFPKRDWQWRFDHSLQLLSLSLGSTMDFMTPYGAKILIPDAFNDCYFTAEHTEFYISILESIQKQIKSTDAFMVQAALNATAAHFMLKPQMPKSWFFKETNICVYSEVGKVFQLHTQDSQILVLVVENTLQAAQIISLSGTCQLAENKSFHQFNTIKVMHNRLMLVKSYQQIVAA